MIGCHALSKQTNKKQDQKEKHEQNEQENRPLNHETTRPYAFTTKFCVGETMGDSVAARYAAGDAIG